MEINSPPYPRTSCTPASLYHTLCELHEWVTDQREWANMKAAELDAPDDPFVPELQPLTDPSTGETRYLMQGVPDMFIVWQAVRAIREKYDDVVRNYDNAEDWESRAAIYYRITAVKSAGMLVSLALLDSEKREAKAAELVGKQRKEMFKSIRKQIEEIPELKNMFGDSNDEDDEIDYDRLFHGDDDE